MIDPHTHEYFMRAAIACARAGMNSNQGGPFGCVIVKNGEIIGRGNNRVTSSNDPTAHAEVVAIREACTYLGNYQLTGCTVYASCEPCPMCLGALYWARPDKIYYACTHEDAAGIGFDDDFIYREMELPTDKRSIPTVPFLRDEALNVFKAWVEKPDKIKY
jgi:guanine deaminase